MRRIDLRTTVATLTVASGVLMAVSAGPAMAERRPSPAELGRKAEVITEQYNAKRLALARAERAERAAKGQVRRASAEYEQLRQSVGALAAQNYMQPGSGSEVALFADDDPQVALDRSSAGHYLATQRANQLRQLVVARMAANRTAAAARDRAAEISRLTADLAKKKKAIEKLISTIPRAVPGGAAPTVSLPNSGKASAVVNAALSRVGLPYVYGAAGPSSFDCSGLMLWAYAKVGVSLPHYTGAQYNLGTHVSRDQLRPGDIVFFYSDLGHNGMYLGGGKMVHAPRTGKNVEVVSLAPYYWSNFQGAVRLL
ncbi:MAG TPA: C40 family peptidase [Streptosporangiaceae bacterium]|nr:C40 family peptidase [Streptosporangiaceae bacterium]